FPQPLTHKTLNPSKTPHPILLPPIAPPKSTHPNNPPQQPLLKFPKSLNLFPNIPPTTLLKPPTSLSPLNQQPVQGTHLLILPQFTTPIYFPQPTHFNNHHPLHSLTYTTQQIQPILHLAFK
ncbi:isocitrate/isopropylmalate family dehydrogenase, partial [Staphylococcus aureus]|uniref:isocitrate/isopropylmalate family dehydrogenase n=1 Tax=Staphylococcus aureus TaxID=1280 RepID=UPI0021B38687